MTVTNLKTKICFLCRHNTKNNEFKNHSHNCYEIVLVFFGKGNAVVNGKKHPVSTGYCFVVPPRVEHTEKFVGYGDILSVGFEFKDTDCALDFGVFGDTDPERISLFTKIFDEYKSQHFGYELAAKALLDLLLLSIMRVEMSSAGKCRDLEYIRSYIEQYFNQKINFRELAAQSGYSYDYFRNIFKKKFGVSPQTYLINLRLENAKQMLETTRLSCTETAYRCGFSNSAQMSVMFKNRFGYCPSSIK